MEGTVSRLVAERKFGFILSGKDEFFFHRDDFNGHFDDLVEDVMKGIKIHVDFIPSKTSKGLRAAEVTRVDGGVA